MPRRAAWILGAGQCVSWGVLYYGFSVLLLPMQSALNASRSAIAGAFSCGLLVAAGAAPWVGRRLDLGGAAWMLRLGNWGGVALLVTWSRVGSVAGLYGVWAGLGLCLALALYEPAFALVGRSAGTEESRVSALATVTVLGGLASTVFAPLSSALVGALGWRGALLALAALLAASTLTLERTVLRAPGGGDEEKGTEEPSPLLWECGHRAAHSPRPGFRLLAVALTLGTLASVSLSSHLIPILVVRGESPGRAAWVLGLLGLAQLPGRLLVLGGQAVGRNGALVFVPLTLQVVGLATLAGFRSLPLTILALIGFGLGAGLQTVARPLLVHRLYGNASAGYLNGVLAMTQGLARAAAPLVAAFAAQWFGYGGFLFALGLALAATVGFLALNRRTPAAARHEPFSP